MWRVRAAALWPGAVLILLFGIDLFDIRDGQHRLDPILILLLRAPGNPAAPLGPAWLAETGRDLTGLGSNGVEVLLCFALCGGLMLAGRARHALALLSAMVLALTANAAVKVVVQRARPDLVPGMPRVFTTSFPSSHAMVSAATFFTVAAIVAAATPSAALRRFAFAMAALGTGLIGLSRVYLGVHYPTDVLGGWAAGAFCAWASWMLVGRVPASAPAEEKAVPARPSNDRLV
jgi:undecaprenyl-diphosphatase